MALHKFNNFMFYLIL